jgi:hypothetical protein
MSSRRRTPLVVAAACLVLASGAAAAEGDAFTATAAPSHVRPGIVTSYTITLTNDPAPSGEADRATITVPPGFALAGQPNKPTVTGCGDLPREWDAEVLADGRIRLTRHDGSANNLCPGGTLSVVFLATSTTVDGAHRWTIELFRDEVPFTIHPGQPEVVVDGTPPQTTITSTPPTITNQGSAEFAFGSTEVGSTFQCRLDGSAFEACTSPKSYSNISSGAHSFQVRATDEIGNTDPNPPNYLWTIDATPPDTMLNARPRARTSATSATFAFTATEAATFECSLDAGAFATCTPPKRYSRLRRGRHIFLVRAIDPAGNVDAAPVVYRWTIVAATRRARASSALLTPQGGARVTSPPLLSWRRVARASYYNVQLYRGRVKLLSTWPTRTRLQLRARWIYLGRQRRLTPGTYQWYVWPGYGRPAARNYGRLLGQSTFTVIARR